jgi:hypothetical protein
MGPHGVPKVRRSTAAQAADQPFDDLLEQSDG